jgi:archaellum biogenesis ATPase FlaH
MPEMLDFVDAWKHEEELRRKIDPNSVCTFGIKPLDDAFTGILKNDLIVIGADSGVGKSEMCLNMAIHNALNKKRVALYFIEGGADEAMARIKWRLMCDIYYKNHRCGLDMDYRKWRMNMITNPLIRKIEDEALEMYAIKLDGYFHVYHFEKGFTITDLTNSLSWFVTKESFVKYQEQPMFDCDLIIIDHLQYFTLTDPKNELREMSDILMKVKDITNFDNIPVILVSHLRKKDKDRGLPSQEDFYGTSNIAKVSSASITITSGSDKTDFSDGLFPTFFRVVKSRVKIPSNLAMLCEFDIKTQTYSKDYEVYKLIADRPAADPLFNDKKPTWARKSHANNTRVNESGADREHSEEGSLHSRIVQRGNSSGIPAESIKWNE